MTTTTTTDTGSLRLLAPARKSRKGDAGEDAKYARQDVKYAERAERDGHVIVATVHDTVSSQTLPWQRKKLRAWMTDPAKLALYDALLVETDRLSRADDEGWHKIEAWCFEHGKRILTTEGVQFPPRDDSDRYQWLGMKRRARTYWEDVRDKHREARRLVLANHAAIGRPPFGYATAGDKMRKRFVPDPFTAPLAVEAFERVASGKTVASVTRWLASQTGEAWRVKRVTDMIRRTSYLGQRDGHSYELLPGMSRGLWESANAVLDARYVPHHTGGRIAEDSFSGCVFCASCGAPMYRHQSARNGQPSGQAKYQCSRGRTGASAEDKCGAARLPVGEVNEALDKAMRGLVNARETVLVTSGGNHARTEELKRLNKSLSAAAKSGDMDAVTRLAGEIKAAQNAEAAPLTVSYVTGDSYAELWAAADHHGRRTLLQRGGLRMLADEHGVRVDITSEAFQHED